MIEARMIEWRHLDSEVIRRQTTKKMRLTTAIAFCGAFHHACLHNSLQPLPFLPASSFSYLLAKDDFLPPRHAGVPDQKMASLEEAIHFKLSGF